MTNRNFHTMNFFEKAIYKLCLFIKALPRAVANGVKGFFFAVGRGLRISRQE